MNRIFAFVVGFSLILGCSGAPTTPTSGRGLLRLEVTPPAAEVFIDGEYVGVVNGWRSQTIPVEAGMLMVELKAKGYMAQRFDIEVGANEEVTLTLAMEEELQVVLENEQTVSQ